MTDEENNRWTCKFCHKSFSHKYKFKNHLSRCIVYTEKTEKEHDVMLELKQELKEELRKTFIDMLDEIKTGFKNTFNQQHQQQPPRRLLNVF